MSEKKKFRQKLKPTTSQLLIDEGPDPELTKPVDRTEEVTTPDEEDINQDQAKEPATPLDPELTKPVDRTEEVTTPDEEDINQDQAEEPATSEAETTATGMASTATSAKFRGTAKSNAAKG